MMRALLTNVLNSPSGYQAPLFTEAFFDEETGISATFGNHVKFPTGTLSTPHCSVELNIRLLDDTLADEDMKKIVHPKTWPGRSK